MKAAASKAFADAQRRLALFTNGKRDRPLINRLKKLAAAPLKVARVGFYRAGLSPAGDLPARMFWGSKLRLPVWDEDAVLAYYTGTCGPAEQPLVAYLLSTLTADDVFYDVGANLGLYSSLASSCGAEVHTFEPNLRTAPYLKMNAGEGATVNTLALSDTEGILPFFEVSLGSKIGMSSLYPDMVPQTNDTQPRPFSVKATTLDAYRATHRTPTVVKIDVMNADNVVLAGARGLLAEQGPILALRLYNTPLAKSRTEETLGLLREAGYMSWHLEADGTIRPTEVSLSDIKFAATYLFKKHV